jgi:hypothetical protein
VQNLRKHAIESENIQHRSFASPLFASPVLQEIQHKIAGFLHDSRHYFCMLGGEIAYFLGN